MVHVKALSVAPRNGCALGQNWPCIGQVTAPGPVRFSERELLLDGKGPKVLCSLREQGRLWK